MLVTLGFSGAILKT